MLREQAHEWAQDHGGRSLRAIATERRRLLQSAKRYPDDPAFALALARLVDLEGSRDDVRAALELARNHAGDPVTGARLALALAQQGFEAGDLGLASRETLRALDLLATPPPHALAHAEVLTSAILARARLAQIERREAESDGLLAEAWTLIDRWSEDGRPQWPWLEAIGAALESGARLAKGQRLEARSALERALRAAVSYGGDLEVAMLCGLLGNLAHEAGDLEGAIGFYRSAVRHARAVQSIATEAVFLGYRGWALHERGDERAARRAYRAAITHAEALNLTRFAAHFRALDAVLGVTLRNHPERVVALARALSDLERAGDLERAQALFPLHALIETRLSRQERDGRHRAARFVRAARMLARTTDDTDDARICLRLARADFERAVRTAPSAVDERALCVTSDAEAFEYAGAAAHLARFPTQRTLLLALVEGWVDDRVATDDELIAAAWPGEKLSSASATHRLQVAVSSLRRSGLGSALARRGNGYRLEVEALVVVAPEALTSAPD